MNIQNISYQMSVYPCTESSWLRQFKGEWYDSSSVWVLLERENLWAAVQWLTNIGEIAVTNVVHTAMSLAVVKYQGIDMVVYQL